MVASSAPRACSSGILLQMGCALVTGQSRLTLSGQLDDAVNYRGFLNVGCVA